MDNANEDQNLSGTPQVPEGPVPSGTRDDFTQERLASSPLGSALGHSFASTEPNDPFVHPQSAAHASPQSSHPQQAAHAASQPAAPEHAVQTEAASETFAAPTSTLPQAADANMPRHPFDTQEYPSPVSPMVDDFHDEEPPRKKRKWVKPVVIAVVALLIVALIAPSVISIVRRAASALSGSSANSQPPISITTNSDSEDTAVAVAAKTTPSVVSVYCTSGNSAGMGSGVILDTQGNILTNDHVIDGADSITVTISGHSYEASVVGSDPSSDLAVIRADLHGDTVVPMEIGDSSQLRVGDWVMSVGSPFGFESSVSQGIVSALYRSTLMEGHSGNTLYANLIQVDAVINPGNSGGALVDKTGRLVGVCTLYSSDTESFAGVGFAIPGNYAIDIAKKIISGSPVTHAYIGLSMQTVNARNARRNNLSVDQGAYIAEVAEGGPGSQAGLKVGDVIVGIGSTDITSADGAILAVRSHSIGETVPVRVIRGTEELTVDVTFASDEALLQQQEENRRPLDEPGTSNPRTRDYSQRNRGDDSELIQELLNLLQERNGR